MEHVTSTTDVNGVPDLAEQLLAFIADEVRLDPSSPVARDTDLLLTGQVDSLGVIEIVGWLERETGIEIDPIDIVLDNFQTVARMLDFVERVRTNAT